METGKLPESRSTRDWMHTGNVQMPAKLPGIAVCILFIDEQELQCVFLDDYNPAARSWASDQGLLSPTILPWPRRQLCLV